MPQIKPKYSGLHHSDDRKRTYRFVAGKAIDVTAADLKALDKKDYELVGKADEEDESGDQDLTKLKKDELLALAEEKKIEVPANATKDEIIALLEG